MSKRAVIRLDGTLEQGFKVTLEVGEEGNLHFAEEDGCLPADLELIQALEKWQQSYQTLAAGTRISLQRITVQPGLPNQIETCRQLSKELQHHFCKWLTSGSFHIIDNQLREAVSRQDLIRVVLRTDDHRLHLLPWHLWSFVERYQAEIAFRIPARQANGIKIPTKSKRKVRILAILGDSQGINVVADRTLLESIPDAEVLFLVEPRREQINEQLWDQRWDLLFFAGHSQTEGSIGQVFINQNDSLTIDDLKFGLRRAIAQGLQLAIFNSCDGLGLAYELETLGIPQMVVMRQPVPDLVAQEFLKSLLASFIKGQRFYLSVREAREKLQGLENQFPCASWLPVIFQNPAQPPLTWRVLRQNNYNPIAWLDELWLQPQLTWQALRQNATPPSSKAIRKPQLGAVLLASVAVLTIVTGIRQLGFLQFWEHRAFDQLMQLRPRNEAPDSRLLLITLTQADVQMQSDRRGSLSNGVLKQVIEKLEPHQPALIGLDIYRDLPVESQYQGLSGQWRNNDRLIGVCNTGDTDNEIGVPPPPDVPDDQLQKRVGFSDSVPDSDGVMRRHLLAQGLSRQSACQTGLSLNLLLAIRYLQQKHPTIPIDLNGTDIKIGDVVFKGLEPSGLYRSSDLGGHQVLLNYRSSRTVAHQLTLAEVLHSNKLTPSLVKDSIVLIGTIDPSFKDYFLTPYSNDTFQQMPGVEIQAHAISQILSAVLDGRPLITPLPGWIELGWIWLWSLVGGVIAWRYHAWLKVGVIGSIAVIILFGCCYVLLLKSIWIPMVPAVLSLVMTGSAVLIDIGLRSRTNN